MTYYWGGMRNVIEAFREYDKYSDRELKRHIKSTATTIAKDAKRRVPRNTGELARSIMTEPLRRVPGFWGRVVIAKAEHGVFVEYGAWHPENLHGKKAPPPFKDQAGIGPWAAQHNLPAAGVAFALLGGDEIKARPFMRPALARRRIRFFDGAKKILFKDAAQHAYQTKGKLSLGSRRRGVGKVAKFR